MNDDYLIVILFWLGWIILGGFKTYFWIELLGFDMPTCKKDYHTIMVIFMFSLILAPVMLLILVVLPFLVLWALLRDAYKDYKDLPYE